GNIYHTVTIGNQVWMVENLKVTHFKDGTAINHVVQDDWFGYPFAAYCDYLDNPTWSASYGRLYNWSAVMDPKGLAPEGWRIPNDNDWQVLEMSAGMLAAEADIMNAWRGSDEGGKLKEAGTSHWVIPNTGATDEFGFAAMPGGWRGAGGHESSVELAGRYWTSNIYNGGLYEYDALFRGLDYNRADILRGHLPRGTGMSVRCIKETR
ncbi:MAG: fibrobacter succinogenes major paralogous domain-containing protein, partial [Candidatus Krumholzibacteriia bacterium]